GNIIAGAIFSPDVGIIRIEKLAKISLTHFDRRDKQKAGASNRGAGLLKVVFQPFFAVVEKDLAFAGVKFARNEERAADIESELVVVHWCGVFSETIGVRVTRPSIRVESRVAKILVRSAVKLIRSRFRGEANLRAGRTTIFRGVVRSEDL